LKKKGRHCEQLYEEKKPLGVEGNEACCAAHLQGLGCIFTERNQDVT